MPCRIMYNVQSLTLQHCLHILLFDKSDLRGRVYTNTSSIFSQHNSNIETHNLQTTSELTKDLDSEVGDILSNSEVLEETKRIRYLLTL